MWHCGEDLCDLCGDCLCCFGGDPCWESGEPESHKFWGIPVENLWKIVNLLSPKFDSVKWDMNWFHEGIHMLSALKDDKEHNMWFGHELATLPAEDIVDKFIVHVEITKMYKENNG